MIRNTLRRLFPSKLVKELIQDLDQMDPMFDRGLTTGHAYQDTKRRLRAELVECQEIAQKAREHESWHSVRVYNLNTIVNQAFSDVACGHFHLWRGSLTMQGEGKKAVCIIATQELITMGAWDPDSMRRLCSDLDEAIVNAG
jgi:hypothetical protein